MNPKDKALELFYSFYRLERRNNTTNAKIIAVKSALILVNEIIAIWHKEGDRPAALEFWQDVKQELINYENTYWNDLRSLSSNLNLPPATGSV